jgi:hypothetical protein
MMGASIVFSAAFFVTVILPRNAGLVGLVVTAALNLTGELVTKFCLIRQWKLMNIHRLLLGDNPSQGPVMTPG